MVAPVQGGVGAWHFMVIAALMIYLPHTEEIASLSKTFALLDSRHDDIVVYRGRRVVFVILANI